MGHTLAAPPLQPACSQAPAHPHQSNHCLRAVCFPQAVAGSKPRVAGDRLAASYANFYICNGGVVAPAFGGEAAAADER